MATKADLHRIIDEIPEDEIEQLVVFLKALAHRRGQIGSGVGANTSTKAFRVSSRGFPDPFERFPPPAPFENFRAGSAGYSTLGEGGHKVEEWRVMYFEGDAILAEYQRQFLGHVFRSEERWQISPDGHQVTMQVRLAGPGHDSSKSVVFALL
jgi:hypothetical protein